MLNLYEAVIKPQSLFVTPLAGDTLFGHLCCQFALDGGLLKRPFADCVAAYAESPFLVVSSAMPRVKIRGKYGYALPAPDIGLFPDDGKADSSETMKNRKKLKKKKWLFMEERPIPRFERDRLLDAEELAAGVRALEGEAPKGPFMVETERSHNSINRLTGGTGVGFAPYTTDALSFLPGASFALFILADESACPPEALRTALERAGAFGYGRDASTGMGRFAVVGLRSLKVPPKPKANACYTLAPCVPPQGLNGMCDGMWARPLTRFGRHGAGVAGNPFKAPVVMADCGAVFRMPGRLPQSGFFGRGVTGVSKARPETIVQGYAPFLPCEVKEA